MNRFLDTITQVCEETHMIMAQEVFGDVGTAAFFQVMVAVKELYKNVDPERINGQVVVFRDVSTDETAAGSPPADSPADLTGLAGQIVEDLLLEVAVDGRVYRVVSSSAIPEELAKTAVVYRYQASCEEFLVGSQRKPVLRLDPSARSQFSVPTFPTLREALQRYATDNVSESTCYIFREAWYDKNRLFLKAKPECLMRRSLTQFLRSRIGGDHDVQPEQNTDESHPVDIQVTGRLSKRLVLIEIKWLGWSAADDGHITAKHAESRAQEGAIQLAQYLDNKRQSAPGYIIQGWAWFKSG